MPTIYEVAKIANVSKTTVSRVLNGEKSVKENNRKKVEAAMKAINFQPNSFAQALATSRSNSIGMLVGSFGGPFYGVLMHHVEMELRRSNIHLITTSGQESETMEREALKFLLSKQVDGLIIHVDTLPDHELTELVSRFPNTIILNRLIPEIASNCLYLDNEFGGYIATKHLIDTGHNTVACLTGQMEKVDCRDRLYGYRRALSEAGIDYNPELVVEGHFHNTTRSEAGRRLLQRNNNIDAVFCQNDNLALSLYTIAAEFGKEVGEDISIVGFDDDNYSEHLKPGLSTIHYPLQEMAMSAVKKVMALVNGEAISPSEMLKPWLIERSSVIK